MIFLMKCLLGARGSVRSLVIPIPFPSFNRAVFLASSNLASAVLPQDGTRAPAAAVDRALHCGSWVYYAELEDGAFRAAFLQLNVDGTAKLLFPISESEGELHNTPHPSLICPRVLHVLLSFFLSLVFLPLLCPAYALPIPPARAVGSWSVSENNITLDSFAEFVSPSIAVSNPSFTQEKDVIRMKSKLLFPIPSLHKAPFPEDLFSWSRWCLSTLSLASINASTGVCLKPLSSFLTALFHSFVLIPKYVAEVSCLLSFLQPRPDLLV